MIALCDWCHARMEPQAGKMFHVRVIPYASGAPRADLEWAARDVCEPCASKLIELNKPLDPASCAHTNQ